MYQRPYDKLYMQFYKTIRKAPRAECARKDMFLKCSRSPTFTHFGVYTSFLGVETITIQFAMRFYLETVVSILS